MIVRKSVTNSVPIPKQTNDKTRPVIRSNEGHPDTGHVTAKFIQPSWTATSIVEVRKVIRAALKMRFLETIWR